MPSRARDDVALFCNKACYDGWQRRHRRPIPCANCGKDLGFLKPTKGKRYCSRICQRMGLSVMRRGHLNPLYRGGRSDLRRHIPHWDALRKRIVERDGHRCQDCGRGNCRLLVHHIVPWQMGGHPTSFGNLVTLCMSCHRFRHVALDRIQVLQQTDAEAATA